MHTKWGFVCMVHSLSPGIHFCAWLLLTECGRTGDFTIHDAEDGVALLAGWVAEQRKQAAASCGNANQKLVLAHGMHYQLRHYSS
jgi:hypothetical protein